MLLLRAAKETSLWAATACIARGLQRTWYDTCNYTGLEICPNSAGMNAILIVQRMESVRACTHLHNIVSHRQLPPRASGESEGDRLARSHVQPACAHRQSWGILPAGSSAAALPADMRCSCSQASPAGATDTFMCSVSCSRWAKE